MYRKLLFLSLLLIAVLVMAARANAQTTGPLEARVRVPVGELTVGDPVQITLEVTHPAGYHVIMPQLEDVWGDPATGWILLSQLPAVTVDNGDGSETTSQVIDTRLFSPGTFETPSIAVSVTDGNGNLVEVVAAPVPVAIASVLTEGDSELRDIKPQAALPVPALWPWIVAGLLALAALGGYLLWRRRRLTTPVDNRLPHQIALDGLCHVESLGLPGKGQFKEHYTLVSDIIRVYVERTQHVPMLESTTGEIRQALHRSDMPIPIAQQLIAFLEASDLVKFSTFTPDLAGAQNLLDQARQLIELTKPVPEEAAVDAPSGQARADNKDNRVAAQATVRHGAPDTAEVPA